MRASWVLLILASCSKEIAGPAIVAAPEAPVAASTAKATTSFTVGFGHACAWKSDGTASCWGANGEGQLGDGTKVSKSKPTPVLLDGIAEMSVGYGFTCARKNDGATLCWGDNHVGKLGDGTKASRTTPAPVVGLSSAVQIASSANHSCALLADGTVACWGDNGSGQLGGDAKGPIVKVAGVASAVEIAVGNSHSCARSSDGTVRCWGNNDAGQLGIGAPAEQKACGQPDAPTILVVSPSWSPKPVVVPILGGATQIAAMAHRTCGRFADGKVRCTHDPIYAEPKPPESMLASVAMISGGTGHACARLDDGTARCFGTNAHGELGDTIQSSPPPISVSGLSGVIEIRSGDELSCARKTDSSLWCWGKNLDGQLGDGTTTDRTKPVRVLF
ncbi:MAG: RCC1 domain-containing protein [Polyangiales bacterium]